MPNDLGVSHARFPFHKLDNFTFVKQGFSKESNPSYVLAYWLGMLKNPY
jgi:hypothetical protein